MEARMTAYNLSKKLNRWNHDCIQRKSKHQTMYTKNPVKRVIKVWMRSDTCSGNGLSTQVKWRQHCVWSWRKCCEETDMSNHWKASLHLHGQFFLPQCHFFLPATSGEHICMWYIVLKHKILTRSLEESYDKMVGERSKYVYCQDGSMVVTVWQNTNPVLMLSNQLVPYRHWK